MSELIARLIHAIGDKVEHLVALALVRDKDWHVLLCSCGAFNGLDDE